MFPGEDIVDTLHFQNISTEIAEMPLPDIWPEKRPMELRIIASLVPIASEARKTRDATAEMTMNDRMTVARQERNRLRKESLSIYMYRITALIHPGAV